MRTSKPGNIVYLDLGAWYNEEREEIHLTARNVEGFHSTVSNDPASKRIGNPNADTLVLHAPIRSARAAAG